MPGPVEQSFAIRTPAGGNPDERALSLLASWAAPDASVRAHPVRQGA